LIKEHFSVNKIDVIWWLCAINNLLLGSSIDIDVLSGLFTRLFNMVAIFESQRLTRRQNSADALHRHQRFGPSDGHLTLIHNAAILPMHFGGTPTLIQAKGSRHIF
jgi:hypothetical protein